MNYSRHLAHGLAHRLQPIQMMNPSSPSSSIRTRSLSFLGRPPVLLTLREEPGSRWRGLHGGTSSEGEGEGTTKEDEGGVLSLEKHLESI